MSIRPMKLRNFELAASQYDTVDDDIGKAGVDFSSVGLYLAGIQTCATAVACAGTSVLSCWVLAPSAVSAVRSLALTSIVALALLAKPMRIGRVRGMRTMFNALRPSVPIYILCLVVEQLVHTCTAPVTSEAYGGSADGGRPHLVATAHIAVYHSSSLFMVLSGLIRAKSPRSESDVSFTITLLCLLLIALLPPIARVRHGPLCEPVDGFAAAERLVRAAAFASVYATLVYAAAPSQYVTNELIICVARATAASVWVMCVPFWGLIVLPFQVILVFAASLDAEVSPAADHVTGRCNGHVYSAVEDTPLRHSVPSTAFDAGSDVETASITDIDCEMDVLRAAIAHARAMKGVPVHASVCSNTGSSCSSYSSNASLSFHIPTHQSHQPFIQQQQHDNDHPRLHLSSHSSQNNGMDRPGSSLDILDTSTESSV